MAGEYGIGQGITAGLQAVNQGIMGAETIQTNRENRRMAAEKQSMYMQNAQLQQDQGQIQIQALQMQLDKMQKDKAKEDVFGALHAYEETNDAKYLNLVQEKNPLVKKLFDQNGVVSTTSISEYSPEKLQQLGYEEGKFIRPVVITKNDGSQEVSDLTGFYAASGFLKEMRKDKLEDLVLKANEIKLKAAEAESGVTIAKGELSSGLITELNSKVKSGEMTMEQAWTMLNNKTSGKADQRPFDVQSAEYFGNIKYKIDNGTATSAEKATYNSWLTKEGGSNVAANEKVSTDVNKIEAQGIDLNSPNFDINNVDAKDKPKVEAVIRDLENTTGGKKLVNNIGKKLGDGIGAVQTASAKLADLASKENVETAVVKNQVDAVKQYIPEALKDISEEDLKDVNFRQAFLSVTATMLKLQSGLTVSEAEAQRFAGSMGTLNKNTKVNMSGLKGKLDEIIGDYEANKALEPTLYNAKYRTPIAGMKQISTQLGDYLSNNKDTKKNQAPIGTRIQNPSTKETMIMTEQGWKPE